MWSLLGLFLSTSFFFFLLRALEVGVHLGGMATAAITKSGHLEFPYDGSSYLSMMRWSFFFPRVEGMKATNSNEKWKD